MSSEMSESFSRQMRLGSIGGAVRRRIEADAAERAALAGLFGLPALAVLSGDFELRPEPRGVIAATLALRARLTQICVLSLEEFEATVFETAELRFVPAASVREGAELLVDAETLEGPDEIPYTGETVDLGAVLAEQLALALDPYPKKPGATLRSEAIDAATSPLAALKRLRPD